MSNHFTGLKLGPPLGDERLDLTDLYAFQAPADNTRTVLILDTNTFAFKSDFHPDAIYRINIDNDGDCETDVAVSVVFSKSEGGRQRATVYLAKGAEARSPEAVGKVIVSDAEVSFGSTANVIRSGLYTFFAGLRSDAFFVDFEGILQLFDYQGGRNFTTHPSIEGGKAPWTGKDRLIDENVFAMVLELPNGELGAKPEVRMWGRCSVRRNDQLLHVDRDGNPTVGGERACVVIPAHHDQPGAHDGQQRLQLRGQADARSEVVSRDRAQRTADIADVRVIEDGGAGSGTRDGGHGEHPFHVISSDGIGGTRLRTLVAVPRRGHQT